MRDISLIMNAGVEVSSRRPTFHHLVTHMAAPSGFIKRLLSMQLYPSSVTVRYKLFMFVVCEI